jgi:hypothetical protein
MHAGEALRRQLISSATSPLEKKMENQKFLMRLT